ncbi:MAG TPA: sulfotransferase [Solirubrobacteraceae bacterium]|nr:sulfotransferase [Solirubrobacteraceae bacterium]
MTWKATLNGALNRATGYQLQRAGAKPAAKVAKRPRVGTARAGDRLVEAPVFVICTLRSGSTLLRVLLDSHSQIRSPHELHLRYVSVHFDQKWSERSMAELGLDAKAAEYLLWDRLLHRELAASGKSIIADKTPNNVFIVERLRECWPDARFIFLLRHPGAIARSRQAYRGERDDHDDEKNADLIRRYCEAVEHARQTYDGHTVRYEDLTTDPERETRAICEFLGIPWEEGMLEYGRFDHGRFKAGLGDWADKIRSGQIQPPEPPPPLEEIPPALREMCVKWGYLPAEVPLDSGA